MPSESSLLPAGVNTIHSWSGMRIELIWIYDGEVHPTNRRRKTDHSEGYWIWLLQRGSVELRQGKNVLRAHQGDCLVSPRGLMEQSFSDDARILSIHFSCEWPTGDNLFREKEGRVFNTADFPDFLKKAKQLSELVKAGFSAPDVDFVRQPVAFTSFLQLQRLFIEWLEVFAQTLSQIGFVFTEIGSIDGRLVHAIRCLKETSLESDLPAALIQKESGLGRSQLDRLFFQTFGISIRSYWNRRKLESAKALLANNSGVIKELSFRLGFKQASHFTKWFQTRTGVTPLAYRQREQFNGAALKEAVESDEAPRSKQKKVRAKRR
ncbi:MAG: helix-turn-helix domain-containing protein [Rariglobus sp.]